MMNHFGGHSRNSISKIYDWMVTVIILCYVTTTGRKDVHYILSIPFILLTMIILLLIIRRKFSIKLVDREFFLFAVVYLIELLLQMTNGSYYSIENAFKALIVYVLMISFTIVFVTKSSSEVFWKGLNFISILSAIIILIQTVLHYIRIGTDFLPSIVKFFLVDWQFGTAYRPCGPFSEPSHFAMIAIISLFYYTFIAVSKKKALLLCAGLAASTSSLGIGGVMIIASLYILEIDQLRRMNKFAKCMIIGSTIVIGAIVLSFVVGSDNWVVQRFLSGSTYQVRIMRSFELYSKLAWPEKIWGIGLQNQERYLNAVGLILKNDSYETIGSNMEFGQVFGYLLCTTGVIGWASFFIPIAKKSIKAGFKTVNFYILFIFVCLVSSIFSNMFMVIYIIAFYCLFAMADTRSAKVNKFNIPFRQVMFVKD